MFLFKGTITKSNMKHSTGTFRQCTQYGDAYCLQIVLTKFMYKLSAVVFQMYACNKLLLVCLS